MLNNIENEENQFERTEILIGKNNLDKLKMTKVAIFGIGGVGSYVAEALIRVGIQNFILIDNDEVTLTNLNRQIHATHKTIGMAKVEVMKDRMLEINPQANIETYKMFYTSNCKKNIINNSLDYIVDAVDTVSTKLELVLQAQEKNINIISCMGTGNKLDPTKLEITDIYKTSVCPLAKVMRKELKQKGIKHLKVVYSKEEPIKKEKQEKIIGSVSFVPSVAGLLIASEIVNDILDK